MITFSMVLSKICVCTGVRLSVVEGTKADAVSVWLGLHCAMLGSLWCPGFLSH